MIVLTVDDSDVNLAVYRGVLAQLEDVDVVTYTSPRDALDWSAQNKPDVVIVDYHMPEIDGITFMQRFRELPESDQTLLVMITGDVERDVRYRSLQAGANDFLTKPIDRSELTARMRNLLALSHSRRQLADRAAWLRDEVQRATAALAAREIETIARLTRAAEFRDDITGMHVIRVGHMCEALARTIGLPESECEMLMLAAPMHDIGKVATPDVILLKPGPLTPAEFEIMKHHTTAGYEILKGSDSEMLRMAAEIALTHHERFDGRGYPRGLQGSEIPLEGRLCSIVDVFDALTSVRPYKEAWPIDRAVATVAEGSGGQFDPELVAMFHASLPQLIAIKKRFADEASTG